MILTKEIQEKLDRGEIKSNCKDRAVAAELGIIIKKQYDINGKVKKISCIHCDTEAVFLKRIESLLTFRCPVCLREFAIVFTKGVDNE